MALLGGCCGSRAYSGLAARVYGVALVGARPSAAPRGRGAAAARARLGAVYEGAVVRVGAEREAIRGARRWGVTRGRYHEATQVSDGVGRGAGRGAPRNDCGRGRCAAVGPGAVVALQGWVAVAGAMCWRGRGEGAWTDK